MDHKKPSPGVSRDHRLSDEGLQRLEKQLESGTGISQQVLAQWVKRYGEPALKIIKKHGRYIPSIDKAE